MTMVGISDVIGALLIVALLAVVLWRKFKVRLDHKIRDNERKKMDEDV